MVGTVQGLQDGVIHTVQTVPRLLYTRTFKPFFVDKLVTGPKVQAIIEESAEFNRIQNALLAQVMEDFSDGREAAQEYEQYRKVYEFGESWDFDEFQSTDPSPKEMKAKMARPARKPFAPRSLQRALSTPQVDPGSLLPLR